MYRIITVFILLVATLTVRAQDYERVDATILFYPKHFDSPEQLSNLIERDFTSEEDKVRAMYSWIIENVAYEPDEYKRFNFNFKNYRERNEKEEKTRQQIIKRTLQKGIAVCEGYAMLLEKLCELQGISNYLVRGDIKTNFNDIGRPFKKSHMWNVVVLDNSPHLIDATWGAGRYNGEFLKEPSYYFYKTKPELFFKTHYPEMYEDSLLDAIVTREVFATMPLIISENLEMKNIESPLNGIIISAESLGAIDFTLTNCNLLKISYSYGNEIVDLQDKLYKDGKLQFTVPLEMGSESLLIYFDEKPALGYKIQ